MLEVSFDAISWNGLAGAYFGQDYTGTYGIGIDVASAVSGLYEQIDTENLVLIGRCLDFYLLHEMSHWGMEDVVGKLIDENCPEPHEEFPDPTDICMKLAHHDYDS